MKYFISRYFAMEFFHPKGFSTMESVIHQAVDALELGSVMNGEINSTCWNFDY